MNSVQFESMTSLRFEWPHIPPSVNKLYTVVRGRKILSKSGTTWKNEFIGRMGGLSPQELAAFECHNDWMYELDLWFYLDQERIFNLGYGVDKRVKSPFADLDVDNLLKITQDCVATLVGIRDRNNFDVYAHKRAADSRGERLIAIYRPIHVMKEGP